MGMPHPDRNNTLMFNLTGISLFCVMVLIGLYVYSGGSLLPSTQSADGREATQTWLLWVIVVAVPLITTVLWILRLTTRRGD
jgi:uncharacterized membrane protein